MLPAAAWCRRGPVTRGRVVFVLLTPWPASSTAASQPGQGRRGEQGEGGGLGDGRRRGRRAGVTTMLSRLMEEGPPVGKRSISTLSTTLPAAALAIVSEAGYREAFRNRARSDRTQACR